MARDDLRAGTRTAFAVLGFALVGVGVLLALRSASELTSLAALLTGALFILVGGVGRLPGEIGLQRVAFDRPRDDARTYREAVYDAVRDMLPERAPPARAADWHPLQPTYWVAELRLRIVVSWMPDESWHVDVAEVRPAVRSAGPDVGVLLVTNVDEIDDLEAAVRSELGPRGAVVRWRSGADTENLRETARGLRAPNGG